MNGNALAVDKMMKGSEQEIVTAAKQGSRAALTTIFDRHWTTVWRAAYAVSGRRELANDAAQDAFLRAGAALGRFDERRPLAPWLAKIAVNRAIDLVRAERRTESLDAASSLATTELPAVDYELHAAVAALPLERRAVIVLHFLLGFTLEETARILDIPAGTVGSRLSRALNDLRQQLEAEHHV